MQISWSQNLLTNISHQNVHSTYDKADFSRQDNNRVFLLTTASVPV